jgi:hypothetical protein
LWITLVCLAASAAFGVQSVQGDDFTDYEYADVFQLPGASVFQEPVFDVLSNGRLITLVGTLVESKVEVEVYRETAVGSRSFVSLGSLVNADFNSWGAAFLRVSPDGTKIAVGNNGGASYYDYEVGVFDLGTLTGDWFPVNHYDAEWIDNANLALTAGSWGTPSVVTALDTTSSPLSPVNPEFIEGIGGSSSGITFDAAGNLYTGNGYDGDGQSDTGWIKSFSSADLKSALSSGVPLNFEASGMLIGDVLSAASLGFDAEGNLHVGGGDYAARPLEWDNAALIRASEVEEALLGYGPADSTNALEVRRFDPDSANDANTYDVNYNDVTGELYFRDYATVYTYTVPEPASLVLVFAGIALAAKRRRR